MKEHIKPIRSDSKDILFYSERSLERLKNNSSYQLCKAFNKLPRSVHSKEWRENAIRWSMPVPPGPAFQSRRQNSSHASMEVQGSSAGRVHQGGVLQCNEWTRLRLDRQAQKQIASDRGRPHSRPQQVQRPVPVHIQFCQESEPEELGFGGCDRLLENDSDR